VSNTYIVPIGGSMFDDRHIRFFLINNGSVKDNNMKKIGLSVEYGRSFVVSPG